MKSLLILRHAEASGTPAGGSDFDRQLTDVGRAQAACQGRVLKSASIRLEKVVCSTAVRARETAELTAAASGLGLEVEQEAEFYNAPGNLLLEKIRKMPDEVSALMIVAHLPGVAELLSLLTTEHVDLAQVYSPGTLSAIQAEGNSWDDLDYGTGALTLFLPPIIPIPE